MNQLSMPPHSSRLINNASDLSQQHHNHQSARRMINHKQTSVSHSGRVSKPTQKAQSASARALHIRTLKIKTTKSSPFLNPVHSSMSAVFSRPSSSSNDNDTAQQFASPQGSLQPSYQLGGLAWPGSTHPGTPQSAISSSDEGNNNRSNDYQRPPTDREVFFTPTTLAELWVLARAAQKYW
jgi:hypothetical protein